MASLIIPNKDLVDKKAIEGLLNLFQACEGKDNQYLIEKGHVQVLDVYTVLMSALKSADSSLLPDAIVAVGQFLHNVSWIGSLTEEQCGNIVLELCDIIMKTKDKSICSRALWCFYSQNLCAKVLSKHIKIILMTFSKTIEKERFVSSSVEFESTRAIKALLSTNPQDVLVLSEIWWIDCLVRTIHPAQRVREMALSIITEHRHILGQNSHVMRSLPFEVKTAIVPGMLKLLSENVELYVLKLWQSIVNLCGKILHQGSSLINSLLMVVEKAFKYPSDDIRVASFACWRELISNFAIVPEVIGNIKRLRLIMQPLYGKNAKTESTIRAKIDTWWHFLSCLGLSKSSFEMVFEPLIQFCFGLGDPAAPSGFGGSHKSRSGLDASSAANAASSSAMNEVFTANKVLLVELGIEILGRFFEACPSCSTMKLPRALTLGPLHHNMRLKPSVLVHHSAVLFHAIEIATCTPLPEMDSWTLVSYIWLNVANHLKSLLDTPDDKPNLHDTISNFYQTVDAVARCDGVISKNVLIILEYAASLPATVLISSSYNLGHNNKQNDTPGFQLLGLLLSKNLVEECGYNNKFTTLFNRLTTFSSLSPVSVLNSFHSSIQIISKAVPDIQKEDLLCKMWMYVVSRLVEFVEESQEVNQGDSLEHDFSCMHSILIFPFQHFIWKLALKRNVLKKWEALYQAFARCAAVVSGVDGNTCCIELATKLKAAIPEYMKIEETEDMIYVLDALLSSVHWSEPKQKPVKSRESTWLRKKAAEIFELAPIIQLIGGVVSSFIKATSDLEAASKPHFVDTASTLMGYFDMIFEKLKNGSIVHAISQLSTQLVEIIRLSCNPESIFADLKVLNKIEDVWEKLTKNLQLNYHGAYDTSLLNTLSPLLEATFSHKKRSIQMDTRLFWQGTFASSYDPHLIPDSLREVIKTLKPSIGMDNSSLDDKTVMSSSESKIGAAQSNSGIVGSGFPSPKVSGSFLKKANKSPCSAKKFFNSPVVKSTPKSKGIEEMSAKEFVVIKSPNKGKRRVLTEHQKEVASRRSLIPAMYVDLSQDSYVTPAETQDVDDSQQTIDKSYKDPSKDILEPCSPDLNKENCAAATPNGKQTLFGTRIETLGTDGSLEMANESASKETIMPSMAMHSEIANTFKVNACVAAGSDEASIDLLNSHSSVINEKSALESTSDGTDNAVPPTVACDSDVLLDNQDNLAAYTKSGDNHDMYNAAKDKQTGLLQALNLEEENLMEADNSVNTSCKKNRRTSLRNCKEKTKVYAPHRSYQLRKKNATKTKDRLSCDFVAESCEFKEISLKGDNQTDQASTPNAKNQSSTDTGKNFDGNMKSKEDGRENNSSRNSNDLLHEMGIQSLGSVSVVCEVITLKMAASNGNPSVETSVIAGKSDKTKTLQKTGAQQQDSVIVISSSSSLEASQSLDTSSVESCNSRKIRKKRKSMEVVAASSPTTKFRKSDKLTEEEVLLNIKARKRKFLNNLTLDSSPPVTRMRKKQKENNSESLESESLTEAPSFRSDAQPLQENVISLTVEDSAPASLDDMLNLQENSDIRKELHSSVTEAVSNNDPEEDKIDNHNSAIQNNLPSIGSKASIDSSLANDIAVECSDVPQLLVCNTLSVKNINEPRRSPRKHNASALDKGFLPTVEEHRDDKPEVEDTNLPNGDETSYDSNINLPTADASTCKQANMNRNTVLQNVSLSRSVARHGSDQMAHTLGKSSHGLIMMLENLSVSPSGIMKKAGKTSTPTTPNKRMVSFADPPVQGESSDTPTSGFSRVVNRRLQMTKGCSQDSSSGQNSCDASQDTYHSPVITDLNCSDCLCPELVGSKESIDILIPHLTSSLHGRGLSKLLSSRNIVTVGDLSALTEADVHTLPIKSPKLPVVRRALLKVSEQAKAIGDGGQLPLPCQSNIGSSSAFEDVHGISLSAVSSPAKNVTSTPEKDSGTDAHVEKEYSPMKSLEDEMVDDSLIENDAVDVLPNTNQQLSSSDNGESIMVPVAVDDDAAATSKSVNDNPFQDIYQFLNKRFEQISPLQLSQVSGSQIRELIGQLGTFSTKVSEAWLDSKCKADPSQNSN